eukprot:7859142-Prorocentrum_lima.AAC.1
MDTSSEALQRALARVALLEREASASSSLLSGARAEARKAKWQVDCLTEKNERLHANLVAMQKEEEQQAEDWQRERKGLRREQAMQGLCEKAEKECVK